MRDAGKCFNAISILSLYSFLFLLSFAQTGNYQYNWWFSRHASKLNYHASKLNYHASFTQVKNKKKNRLPFNKLSRNWEYCRSAINKQRSKISGMCDIPNSSCSAKDIIENYCVRYGDAMLEPLWGTTWRPETSGNISSLLWLSQNVSSLC